MEGRRYRADFDLSKSAQGDVDHLFVVWADTQVYDEHELEYLEQAAEDFKQLVTEAGKPAVAVSCGDIVGEWNSVLSLFLPVAEASAKSDVQFYYMIGNHDIETDARSNDNCREVFKSL